VQPFVATCRTAGAAEPRRALRQQGERSCRVLARRGVCGVACSGRSRLCRQTDAAVVRILQTAMMAFAAASAVRRSHWNRGDHARCGEANRCGPLTGAAFFARPSANAARNKRLREKPASGRGRWNRGYPVSPLPDAGQAAALSLCNLCRRATQRVSGGQLARRPLRPQVAVHENVTDSPAPPAVPGTPLQRRRGWSSSDAARRPRSSPRALRASPRTGASRAPASARGGA
jgi:hypothetical protein